MSTPKLATAFSLPSGFRINEVHAGPRLSGIVPAAPSLGPLADFNGNWHGNGFNTIFRPDNSKTPTPLPIPAGGDNILELNLTNETLSFSPSLGSVPNRGTDPQGDIFLNGVPYLQSITDVTNAAQPTGIHFEPGLWMSVPATSTPAEGVSVVRMASIPHGTTITAQGTSSKISGAPNIPSVDITPFITGSNPKSLVHFASQTAATPGTPRIPQDLTSFISAGTITQAMLDDPNSVLRNHISHQKIVSTTIINISTNPDSPLFGGGADNIAFLQGNPTNSPDLPTPHPNAQTLLMDATFWIETVEHTILVPVFKPGQAPLQLHEEANVVGKATATFTVRPPVDIKVPRPITFTSKQIQYSQVVFLNFNGLTWPHVSVATLVPAGAVPIPPSAWQ